MGREIRRAFVARPGCVLVDGDYSQIELRVLAHMSGDEAMCDAFIRGQDIHTRTAAEINGVPMQQVTGEMRSADGVRVGEHPGVFYFTLGQREGLNIGGVRGRPQAPWFVVGKDIERNLLYVDQGHDSPWLQSTQLRSETAHWVAGHPPATRFACTAQTRYRQPDEACEVEVLDDGTLSVRFARPQRAVTPGQSLVLYDGDACLGGAIILSTDAPVAGLANARNNAA